MMKMNPTPLSARDRRSGSLHSHLIPRRASRCARRFGRVIACVVALSVLGGETARPGVAAQDEGPEVLLVVAHPDDEAMFAATVYRITRFLDGAVDLALITDGSGGYRYAQLAEPIYGRDLTDEAVARRWLPAIRKRELMAGGRIIGLRKYFFLDEYDHRYTENTDSVLNHVWDTDRVRQRLGEIMAEGGYDFVFAHLPIQGFHAHHKAATILALEAAAELEADRRPVVLGSFVGGRDRPEEYPTGFEQLPGFPITRVDPEAEPFVFDRNDPLSADGRLDYQIIVNWLIAEHKTQGTMQLLMNRGDVERFWVFRVNPPDAIERTEALFDRLSTER